MSELLLFIGECCVLAIKVWIGMVVICGGVLGVVALIGALRPREQQKAQVIWHRLPKP